MSFLRLRIWIVYAVLFAVAVPWYWPRGDRSIWLGLPAWTAVAVLASVAISAYTAWLLRTPWQGEGPESADAGGSGGRDAGRSAPSGGHSSRKPSAASRPGESGRRP